MLSLDILSKRIDYYYLIGARKKALQIFKGISMLQQSWNAEIFRGWDTNNAQPLNLLLPILEEQIALANLICYKTMNLTKWFM